MSHISAQNEGAIGGDRIPILAGLRHLFVISSSDDGMEKLER